MRSDAGGSAGLGFFGCTQYLLLPTYASGDDSEHDSTNPTPSGSTTKRTRCRKPDIGWRPQCTGRARLYPAWFLPPAVIAMDLGTDATRRDFDRGRAGARADHRLQVRAFVVLRAVCVIDAVIDRPVDGLEGDLLRAAGNGDPPCLLQRGGFVPPGVLPVVRTHVECTVDHDGPDPGRGAVGNPILAERRNVQVVGLGDLAQFVSRPSFHCKSFLKARRLTGAAGP